VERFRLADRSITPDDSAAAPQSPPAAPRPAKDRRPPGVSRWVNAHGKISLAGFSYHVGATYVGEPVEVVVAGGLVDILHAGVVVATHAQRMRDDQADRLPRAPVTRRARDATAGLTVTRLADAAGVVSFAGTSYAAGRRWARQPVDVSIVAGSGAAIPGRPGHPGPPHPARPGPRARRLRQPQGTTPTQELRHRHCRLATRTHLSPGYPNLTQSLPSHRNGPAGGAEGQPTEVIPRRPDHRRTILGGLRTCKPIARQLERDVPAAPRQDSSTRTLTCGLWAYSRGTQPLRGSKVASV